MTMPERERDHFTAASVISASRGKQRGFRGGRLAGCRGRRTVSGDDQFPRAGGAARTAKIRQLSEAFAASSSAFAIRLAAFALSRAMYSREWE